MPAGKRIDKVTALTDNSGGTASDTIPDVPATYDEATLADIVASLAGKVNELVTALQNAGLMER